MSEIEFLTVCAGCSIFTDIWASENQSLRTSEGIAAPQSRENLQTFVRSEAVVFFICFSVPFFVKSILLDLFPAHGRSFNFRPEVNHFKVQFSLLIGCPVMSNRYKIHVV